MQRDTCKQRVDASCNPGIRRCNHSAKTLHVKQNRFSKLKMPMQVKMTNLLQGVGGLVDCLQTCHQGIVGACTCCCIRARHNGIRKWTRHPKASLGNQDCPSQALCVIWTRLIALARPVLPLWVKGVLWRCAVSTEVTLEHRTIAAWVDQDWYSHIRHLHEV